MARTEGVFKRGKTYWIRYSVAGKQYRESAKTTRKEEAVGLLRKRQSQIFEGTFFPDRKRNDLTVEGLKRMWEEGAAGKKTIGHDKQRLKRVVDYFGAQTLVATITSEDVDGFKRYLSGLDGKRKIEPGKKARMAPATVNRHLAVLRAALRLADRRGYRHRDPMAGVKFNRENNQRDRICSDGEYKKLIDAADSELRLAIVFGYWTGMRLGEVASLRWKQVDLAQRVVRLKRSDTKEAEAKQVPLAGAVVDELDVHPRRLDGRLFVSRTSALSSGFASLAAKLGIEDLRYHDLRHTAVTNLRRAGVDIITIKAITGHKTLKTLERYNKVTAADLAEAVQRAERRAK